MYYCFLTVIMQFRYIFWQVAVFKQLAQTSSISYLSSVEVAHRSLVIWFRGRQWYCCRLSACLIDLLAWFILGCCRFGRMDLPRPLLPDFDTYVSLSLNCCLSRHVGLVCLFLKVCCSFLPSFPVCALSEWTHFLSILWKSQVQTSTWSCLTGLWNSALNFEYLTWNCRCRWIQIGLEFHSSDFIFSSDRVWLSEAPGSGALSFGLGDAPAWSDCPWNFSLWNWAALRRVARLSFDCLIQIPCRRR